LKLIITSICCVAFTTLISQTYFNKYQLLADSLETIYQIPSSVMLAIAYYESGAGKSMLARKSNNHFGIVGKNPHYRSRYRYFKSDTASYEGFCKLICNKSFYRKLAGTDDTHQWILAISNAGYAQNATAWRHKILAIIKSNELS